jgi:hypothetical protein
VRKIRPNKNTESTPVTSDTIIRFNRETLWLAMGLLGTLVFAALALAFQESQRKARQAESDFFPNANLATMGSAIAKSSNSNGKLTPEPESSVDNGSTETSLREIPSSRMEPAASPPTSVLAAPPAINRNAHRQYSPRVREPKTRNLRNRSSGEFGSVDVKRRLIELWHQSLARSTKPRDWTAFSKLNSGVSKKATYTAETNH